MLTRFWCKPFWKFKGPTPHSATSKHCNWKQIAVACCSQMPTRTKDTNALKDKRLFLAVEWLQTLRISGCEMNLLSKCPLIFFKWTDISAGNTNCFTNRMQCKMQVLNCLEQTDTPAIRLSATCLVCSTDTMKDTLSLEMLLQKLSLTDFA